MTTTKIADREYIIQAAKIKGLTLLKPSKAEKTIMIYDYSSGFGRCIVEAMTWAEARKQLNAALAW